MDIQNSFTSRPDEFGIVDSCSPNLLRHDITDEIKMVCSEFESWIVSLLGHIDAYNNSFLKSMVQSVKPMSKGQTVEDTMYPPEEISTGNKERENACWRKQQIAFVEPKGCGRGSFTDIFLLLLKRQTVEDTMFPSEGISTGIEDEIKTVKPTYLLMYASNGAVKRFVIDSKELSAKPMSKRKWYYCGSDMLLDTPVIGRVEKTISYLCRMSDVIRLPVIAQTEYVVKGHKTFGAEEPDWRPKQSREKELRIELLKWTKPKKFKFHKDTHELEQLRKCKVCLDKDSCVIFFPCRHMATCESCEGFLQRCPICRSPINKAVKINED